MLVYCQHRQLRNLFVDDTLYSYEIKQAAAKYGLDPELVRAVIFQESRFDPGRIGQAGEVGLMQVLPEGAAADWARTYKISRPSRRELKRPVVNLDIGCFYLAKALKRWQGYKDRLPLALCQYNAGASRAKRWAPKDPSQPMRGNINIKTTRKYVDEIMERYKDYCMERENAEK